MRLLIDKLAASVGESRVDVGEGVEATVDDRFVDEGPQPFGGLKLRRVWRQEDEPHPVRDRKACFAMPSSVIEDENDAALSSGADGFGEIGEQFLEEWFADAIGQTPDRLPVRRLDEGCDVEP